MSSARSALLLSAALVSFSMATSCQEDPARAGMLKDAKEILAIRPSPAMPKAMAEKIMRFYFLHNISGCGFPGELVDEGEYWTATPRVGIAGKADKDPIRLHKGTGRISWGQGPAFESLKAMVKAAK